MALVLSLGPKSAFYIDGQKFTMVNLGPGNKATIRHEGSGHRIRLNDLEAKEVRPGVFVASGKPTARDNLIRLAFDAPRSISIMRDGSGEDLAVRNSDQDLAP